jgi:hypothetical protein
MTRSRALLALTAAVAAAALACDLTSLLPEVSTPAPLFGQVTPPWATMEFGAGLSQGPVGIGQSLTLGNVEVRVNDFIRPANDIVLRAEGHPELEPGEEFAVADISSTCRAEAGGSCHITEFSFALRAAARRTYSPELSMFMWGLRGLFEGGELAAGETRSGYLVFSIDQDESGLELIYSAAPGGFGPQAVFALGS